MKRKYITITLGTILALPLVLVGATYAALRSERLIKGYIIPRISESVGVSLSVESIEIHPLNEISLKGLRYDCEGALEICPADKPLALKIGSLKVAYTLSALLAGKLEVTSLELKEPQVAIRTSASDNIRNESPSATPIPLDPSKDSSSSSFGVRIANATITDGTFVFRDGAGVTLYELEGIQANAAQVHSDGESDVALKTRASVRVEGLQFSKQEISIRGNLRDAIGFQPAVIDLSATAGPSAVPSLKLGGSLLFDRSPYALREIALREGTIRDSLLRVLGIPVAPIREFEYDVSGNYKLSAPAEIAANISIKKNLFSGSETHDLKSSTVSAKLKLTSDQVSIADGAIEVFDNGVSIVKTTIAGNVAYDLYKRQSELSIRAPFVDLGALRALAGAISPNAESSDNATPTNTTSPSEQAQYNPIDSLRLPIGKLIIAIDRAIIQKQEATPFRAEIHIPHPRSIQKARVEATFAQGGTASFDLNGSFDDTIALKTVARNVNIIPFAALASGPHGEIVEGSLQSADINLTARGRDIRKSLTGNITFKISKLIVPSTLQGQVPFNILFIPFDALITVFGGAINLMLPPSISSVSDSIRQTLDKAGRLGLDASTVDLQLEKGKILFRNVDINTKNLPDFTIKGNVSAEDRLDLTVFISLLKLNLPLPVVGSPSAPLPDVVYLGPEIVRGLGLSVGSIASGAVGLVTGSSSDKKSDGMRPDAPNPR